ncbi:hypothetical protein CR513_15296, partial [Mucuna pruriens]
MDETVVVQPKKTKEHERQYPPERVVKMNEFIPPGQSSLATQLSLNLDLHSLDRPSSRGQLGVKLRLRFGVSLNWSGTLAMTCTIKLVRGIRRIEYPMLSLLITGCLILLLLTLILNLPIVLIPSRHLTCFLYLLCLIVLMINGFQKPNLFKGYMIRCGCTWKIREKSMQRMLRLRGDDLFKIIKKINDNVNKVDMPQEFGRNISVNVIDLTPYVVGTQTPNLWSNSLQEGEDDAYMGSHSKEDEGKAQKDLRISVPKVGHALRPRGGTCGTCFILLVMVVDLRVAPCGLDL